MLILPLVQEMLESDPFVQEMLESDLSSICWHQVGQHAVHKVFVLDKEQFQTLLSYLKGQYLEEGPSYFSP